MIRAPKICGGSHIRAGLSGYVAEMAAAFTCASMPPSTLRTHQVANTLADKCPQHRP